MVLDNDDAGELEAKNLNTGGFLDPKSIFILREPSLKPSEIEDLIEPSVYLDTLQQEFGRQFKSTHFADPHRKWSQSFALAANSLGVVGSDAENLTKAKVAVSNAVQVATTNPAKPSALPGFEALRFALWG